MCFLVCWGREGQLIKPEMQLNSLAKRFARQIGGRKKLCMMPCHSFHVYGTWNSKEVGVGVGLKSSFGGGQDITGEDHFCGGGGIGSLKSQWQTTWFTATMSARLLRFTILLIYQNISVLYVGKTFLSEEHKQIFSHEANFLIYS